MLTFKHSFTWRNVDRCKKLFVYLNMILCLYKCFLQYLHTLSAVLSPLFATVTSGLGTPDIVRMQYLVYLHTQTQNDLFWSNAYCKLIGCCQLKWITQKDRKNCSQTMKKRNVLVINQKLSILSVIVLSEAYDIWQNIQFLAYNHCWNMVLMYLKLPLKIHTFFNLNTL